MDIRISVEGITPLLLHAFTEEEQLKATGGNRISAASGDRGTPEEQAEQHLYKGLNGELVIPQPNLLACIIGGGTFFKAGKSKVTTQRSSLIPAVLTIEGATIPLVSAGGWSVDTRPVRIPATGGRILRHRPIFYDWKLDFNVQLDEAEMSAKLLRDIVDAAGSKIGLGDFRPVTRGPYGRFKVIRWEVIAVPVAPKVRPLKKVA